MTSLPRPPRLLLIAMVASLGLVACSGAAAPAPSRPAPTDAPSTPPPTIDPGDGAGSDGSGGSGGVIIDPPPIDPPLGQPTIVVPRPGQLSPHTVAPLSLEASVVGRHVLVRVSWYSGVEPCNVLDSVRVDRSGTVIAITLIEGASRLDVACMEIAQLKATIVDLGDLEPGTWTITAPNSEAPPVLVTIS